MAEGTNCSRLTTDSGQASQLRDSKDITGTVRDAQNYRPTFNRYLYENLLSNLEGQAEAWNRMAVRSPNPEAAHALWLKAEGLGYALRLLYAFEPEFRELVEHASRAATGGTIQR